MTIKDKELVKELFRDVFTSDPWYDDWSDDDQLDAYICDLTGQNNSLTLGYFDGERMVGLSMGLIRHWFTGTEYCIDEFCVDRHFQGKGVGSEFMKEIEAFLSERQIYRIFLQTEKDAPAYEFYTHMGFTELIGHVSFAKEIEI